MKSPLLYLMCIPAGYSVKHLFPYLNADDSTSEENERGPSLVTQ